jgi:hypothetical protein
VGREKIDHREMRVIDLDTGDTLQAANDEDLVKAVTRYYEERGASIEESDAAQLVSDRAYDALDS